MPWRSLRALVGVTLALASGTAIASTPAACADPVLPVVTPTLVVSVTAARATYRPGEVAVLEVSVRSGSAVGPKVSGAAVKIVLARDSTLATLYGDTDAVGEVRLPWRVGRAIRQGPVSALAGARAQVLTGYDCSGLVYQSGSVTADPVLRVR